VGALCVVVQLEAFLEALPAMLTRCLAAPPSPAVAKLQIPALAQPVRG
jgi:hypothetical protein